MGRLAAVVVCSLLLAYVHKMSVVFYMTLSLSHTHTRHSPLLSDAVFLFSITSFYLFLCKICVLSLSRFFSPSLSNSLSLYVSLSLFATQSDTGMFTYTYT